MEIHSIIIDLHNQNPLHTSISILKREKILKSILIVVVKRLTSDRLSQINSKTDKCHIKFISFDVDTFHCTENTFLMALGR